MSVPHPETRMMTRSAQPAYTRSDFANRSHTARTASSMMREDPSAAYARSYSPSPMYPPRTAASMPMMYPGPQTRSRMPATASYFSPSSSTRSPATRSHMMPPTRDMPHTASHAPFARTRSHLPENYHQFTTHTNSAFPSYHPDEFEHPAFTQSDFNGQRSTRPFTPNTRSQFPSPVFSPRHF